MKARYYILTFLLCFAVKLYAQDVKFTASVEKSTVAAGEQFEINFSVNGNGAGFTPPDLSGFQVLGGPNVSTSMQSINGNTTVSTAFSYVLMGVKEGTFTIGPATIVVNGHRLSSNPVKIKVVKGKTAPQSSGNGQRQQQDNSGKGGGNIPDLSKLLFIRAIVDKDNVYQGQQLTLTYRIYTRVGIVQSQANKLPDLTGFWNQDVKAKQQAQFKPEMYKGLKYEVADIKQIILFPEHAGSITIDPFEMTFLARVQVQSNDIMDQFFGGATQDVNYKAKSLPLTVHVRPLPTAGKPDSYTGAVGNFKLESSIDKNRLKTNEALNYKITISGSGNIKLLKNLNTVFPADFEKYDPKIVDTVNENLKGVSGSRIYNYLLIPRHQGDFTIDPVKFSYFNPATGKYVSLSTKQFNIRVDKGATENNVTALVGDKQDIKLLNKDIRYIKTGDAGLNKEGENFFGSLTYYLLLLLGPVLSVLAVIYRNWNRRNNSDIVKVKSRRAGRVAAKHLANAQKELKANNTKAFYEAVFRGLYGYLSDKLSITYADLDKETIASTLKARSAKDETINQLLDTLDLCEMARYAPVDHISEQEVFEKAKGTINAIENEI